jgi:hypothetical protein
MQVGSVCPEMNTDFVSEGLRTVGEDLEFRGIKTFSIRCDGDFFVVEGGYQPPPAPMPVTLHYSRKDIEELDRKACERGDHLSARTSFIHLPEILPAIADYVEARGAQLLSLSNAASTETDRVIDIEYETNDGDSITERLTGADVYALCVRGHKRRQREKIAQSRFTRFSTLLETDPTR